MQNWHIPDLPVACSLCGLKAQLVNLLRAVLLLPSFCVVVGLGFAAMTFVAGASGP